MNSIISHMPLAGKLIAPSLLASDFSNISAEVSRAENSGADWLHLDVMDGSFVSTISFGEKMVATIRKLTSLPLDAHLMVVNPQFHIESFIEAGVDRLTFHIEAANHAHRLITSIRDRGLVPGIAINPATPVAFIAEILEIVGQVLVMTVNPGFGGQCLIPAVLNKVRTLAELRDKGAGDYRIVVDGGFCRTTAADVWEAGADIAVMGTAFFDAKDPSAAIHECRNIEKSF